VPLIVGVGAVVNAFKGAAATAAVGTLVFAVVAYPAAEPVTVTVILWPTSAAAKTYLLDVAPAIATPSRNH